MKGFVIAIDGTSASGKGTLAAKVANYLGFDHMDTGLLYRKVAWDAINAGVEDSDQSAIIQIARKSTRSAVEQKLLCSAEIGQYASKNVAHIKEVREVLLKLQRDFSVGKSGVVLDGRDIGTVVFPEAELKLFITANVEERAMRRYKQLQNSDGMLSYSGILEMLKERDAQDSMREHSPSKPANDAIVIDTTNLSAEEVFQATISLLPKEISGSMNY